MIYKRKINKYMIGYRLIFNFIRNLIVLINFYTVYTIEIKLKLSS